MMITKDPFGRYGDAFNWHIILPPDNQTFTEELKRELGENHPLSKKQLRAVAKCDSNDDVLYRSNRQKNGREEYYIVHLTWKAGPPRYQEFIGIEAAWEYIEYLYLTEYL